MPDMRIADFLRHDVQAYGVPGAPDIDRILQACIEAADWIDKLESILAQVERERDAAICELPHNCWNCIYHLDNPIEETDTEGRTIHCYCTADVCYPEDNSSWQWRGVREENTKEEGK